MAIGPVIGVSVGTGIVPTGAGTPHVAPALLRLSGASPGLFILPKYGVPSPVPWANNPKPILPLPGTGGGGGGGPVGYPIDSG